jgi:thiol-disulfide isomerase/thioredoxin
VGVCCWLSKAHADTPHGFLKQLGQSDPEALDRQAEAFFERVLAEFKDVKLPAPYFQTPMGELARGDLFKLKNLSIGKVAPEIIGDNLDGRSLRLSDFRGKVVAIVFWATWCGPCMSNIPKERDLVKRLENEPFVLLGVNADDDLSKAQMVVDNYHINWCSWRDGHAPGPIVSTWGISGWPTHYLLDTKRVIRYQNPQGDVFYQAIDHLVAEAKAESQKKGGPPK